MSSNRTGNPARKITSNLEKKDSTPSESGKDFISDVFGGNDSPKNKKPQDSVNSSMKKNSQDRKKSRSSSESSEKPKRKDSSDEEEKVQTKKKSRKSSKKSSRESSRSSSRERKSKALVPIQATEPETKTFLTQKREEEKQEAAWTLNDLLFPGGKISKLCRITNPKSKDIKISEILKRSGIVENNPVILLSGVEGEKRAGLLVGIARAAYSTDAIIVDNGLKSGIETACYRKKVKLLGVCPEEMIVYPTKASTGDRLGELSAGHSHLIVMGTKGDGMRWEYAVSFKLEVCNRIRHGRGGQGSLPCRALCVVVGDNTGCIWEAERALKADMALLVLEASPVGRDIVSYLKGKSSTLPETFKALLKKGEVYVFPESGTAEHLASAVHLYLAICFKPKN
ncbi:hypothetical protein SteCoe_4048 [Stentor coeruleus]|uniref:LSDAT prokaryote domain-containing protein n=1 Tax=Stentor coeruleus TaxID=5963 RepID=A0A1R2CVR9_9CILI|nr:hypothetical protein SteCoe_4048 [Stentor coeruleus]